MACGPFAPTLPAVFADQALVANRADCRLELSPAAGTTPVWIQTGFLPVGVCTGYLALVESVETLGAGEIRYQFSRDRGATWMKWTGSAWAQAANDYPGDFAEASPAATLTPAVMAQLTVPAGGLVMRIWFQTANPASRPVLISAGLTVTACLPAGWLLAPANEAFNADTMTLVTASDGGVEQRRLKGPDRRRWELTWQGLPRAEAENLRAWAAAKQRFLTWLWEDPATVGPGTSLGTTYTVRFDEEPVLTPAQGAGAFWNARAVIVEVAA